MTKSSTWMPEERNNDRLTATLPAWMWRRILYAVEAHADERASYGHDEIAARYTSMGDALAKQLGVKHSGDLPHREGDQP